MTRGNICKDEIMKGLLPVRPSKLLAILWTIGALLSIVYATQQFLRRPETGDFLEDIVIFALFTLPYMYVSVLYWRGYFKAQSQERLEKIKTEQ